jgi:hypothetical protein
MRILKTFFFLMIATALAWGCVYLGILTPVAPPLLFALAINLSNDAYFKYKSSSLIIILTFIVIFLWGTLPFYQLAQLISNNQFATMYAGAFGCFLLITLTIRFTLNDVNFGLTQFILTLILPLFAIYLYSKLSGQSVNYEKGLMYRFDLVVLIYQLFLTVNILVTMIKTSGSK